MGTSEKTIRKMGLIVFTISTLAIADVNGQVILNDMSAQSLENGPKRLLEDTSSQVLELGGKRLLNDGFFTHENALTNFKKTLTTTWNYSKSSVLWRRKRSSPRRKLRKKIKIMDSMLQKYQDQMGVMP